MLIRTVQTTNFRGKSNLFVVTLADDQGEAVYVMHDVVDFQLDVPNLMDFFYGKLPGTMDRYSAI